MNITTVGLDLAKNVLQVHGVNGAGDVIVRRRLRRARVGTYFVGLKTFDYGSRHCPTRQFSFQRAGRFRWSPNFP